MMDIMKSVFFKTLILLSLVTICGRDVFAQEGGLSPILVGAQLNLVQPKIDGMADVFERRAGIGLFGSANLSSFVPVPMIEPRAGLHWARASFESKTEDFNATTTFSPFTAFLEPSFALPIPRESMAGIGGRAFIRFGAGFSRTTMETSYDAKQLLLGKTYGGGSSSAQGISPSILFSGGLAFDHEALSMLELIFDYSIFWVFESQTSSYNHISFGIAYKI